MAKKLFLLFIPIIIVFLYFNTTVKYDLISEKLVTTDQRDAKNFEEKFINDIAYFSSFDDWNNFSKIYFKDNQISNSEYRNGPIIVLLTDLYKDKKSNLFEVTNIKRNLLSFDIELRKKAMMSLVNGFEDDANVKNIMIYQINSHSIGSDLIKKLNINVN